MEPSRLTVYRIEVNVNRYQMILPVSEEFVSDERFDFNGTKKLSAWESEIFYVDNPLQDECDFFSLTNSSAFACTSKAVEVFSKFWMGSAELLPILLENGKELFIVNVIDCVNALDHSKTVYDFYDDGTRSNRIIQYSFKGDRFHESSIFKVPETAQSEILTYQGIKRPEDEFYYNYLNSGLNGLTFSKIFST